jgi:hypothetical protein
LLVCGAAFFLDGGLSYLVAAFVFRVDATADAFIAGVAVLMPPGGQLKRMGIVSPTDLNVEATVHQVLPEDHEGLDRDPLGHFAEGPDPDLEPLDLVGDRPDRPARSGGDVVDKPGIAP